jgi:phenylalanyl-tRNA synthetase beta chain
MKLSLQWLSDYIDISDYFSQPQELAQKLTAAGIEVESIQNLAKQFEFVVVGHILEKGQHPNADRLSLCQVTTGEGKVHQIVCGAQNHKQGDNVVVALPGAILPGDFVIKNSKIRGVESGGMLCSEKELGLKTESEGILILPKDAPIGKSFAAYMGYDDIVFELKVTPNRADCLSHFGLAREVGCLLGIEAKWPAESFRTSEFSTRSQIQLKVETPELCPRFTGLSVRGVKVGPSPAWLSQRLESIGVKSINNVVDVTNFVMMEIGQPLHAYDASQLQGGQIKVSLSRANEKFVSLDGTEYQLSGDELTIRDGERIVGLAGVVGGQNSGVKDETTDLFLECAAFNPSQIRRAARRLGIETEAAYRFSRGINIEAVPLALQRAAGLIQKVAGGEVGAEAYDLYPQPQQSQPIQINLSTLQDRLGYSVDPNGFVDWMQRLGCEVEILDSSSPDIKWAVKSPLFRVDLSLDVDLVEEFARLHGYQHIPENLPGMSGAPAEHHASYLLERKVRRLWQSQGYYQAINYAFGSEKYQTQILGAAEKLKAFGLRSALKAVPLLNPLNEELGVMRTSLIPGLMKNVLHNLRLAQNTGGEWGQLFEIGFSHGKNSDETAVEVYSQESRLGLARWGEPVGLWQKEGAGATCVFELKAHIENFLRSLGFSRISWSTVGRLSKGLEAPDFLHPGQCAALNVEGKAIGFIGALHPSLKENFKIRTDCALAEINLEKLMPALQRSPRFKALSNQPAVDRDIAFVMPKDLPVGEVESLIRKVAGEVLVDVFVFDVFSGESLPPGQRSVAFRLIFQDLQVTLSDTQVNQLRDKVVVEISQKYGLTQR